jgi:phosphoribosylformimino-5-aminoimidazole carboxamide ribotide isomerase
MIAVGVPVIASGGVGTLGDLRCLRAAGAAGAIVGRALYIGAIDLHEAIMEIQGADEADHPLP